MMDKARYQRNAVQEQVRKKSALPVECREVDEKPAVPVQKERLVSQPVRKQKVEDDGGVYLDSEAADQIVRLLGDLADKNMQALSGLAKLFAGEEPAREQNEARFESEVEPEDIPEVRYEPKHELGSMRERKLEPEEKPSEKNLCLEKVKAWRFPDAKTGKLRYVSEDNFWDACQLTRSQSELNLVWVWLEDGRFAGELKGDDLVEHCSDLFL